MFCKVSEFVNHPRPVRNLTSFHCSGLVVCAGLGIVQGTCQIDQLHEFASVAVWVLAPGLAGQCCDVVVAVVFEVLSASQFLAEGRYRCCEVEAVAATCIDAAIQYR